METYLGRREWGLERSEAENMSNATIYFIVAGLVYTICLLESI